MGLLATRYVLCGWVDVDALPLARTGKRMPSDIGPRMGRYRILVRGWTAKGLLASVT